MIFCKNRSQLAQSVGHLLSDLKPDLPWIMTITPEKSGGYSVGFVTIESLEGFVEIQSKPSTTISLPNILDG